MDRSDAPDLEDFIAIRYFHWLDFHQSAHFARGGHVFRLDGNATFTSTFILQKSLRCISSSLHSWLLRSHRIFQEHLESYMDTETSGYRLTKFHPLATHWIRVQYKAIRPYTNFQHCKHYTNCPTEYSLFIPSCIRNCLFKWI